MPCPTRLIVALLIAAITILSTDGYGKDRTALPIIDSPAWPESVSTIAITWTHRGSRVRKGKLGEEIPVVSIDLTLRAGNVERRFTTTAEINVFYSIGSQRKCQSAPLPRNRVAELTLEGGGFQMFALLRGRDELKLVREILTDGSCDPDPCPVKRTVLARIPIPPNVRFEEHFRIGGQREEETCP